MGETRGGASRPPERAIYPGLVRPYTDEKDYVNQPKFVANRMLKPRTVNRQCSSDHDPFAIYDDDSAHDHYFFLPAGKVDLTNFKRTSTQQLQQQQLQQQQEKQQRDDTRNSKRDSCGTWSRTKPPDISNSSERENVKNTNNEETTHCQCKTTQTQDVRHIRHCRRNKDDSRRNLLTKDSRTSVASGDYCSLSADAVAPHYPGIIRSRDTPIDEESFRKFALNLVRSTSNSPSDINRNTNDYHDPSRTTNTHTNCDEHIREQRTYEMYEISKCIDQCTCMVCVKAGRYHWTGDTDSYIEEPCNCIGGRKNIVRRWLCMGVLALFLPCLICYLPAKLCQNSCTSSECSQTKLKGDNKRGFVKYVTERSNNDKVQDEGLL